MTTRKPNDSDQPGTRSQHYAEIIRPDTLGQWAIEKNPTLQYLHEAMHDWGERQGDPSRRPVCMACPHEFHVNASMPSAWMFVRLSVNRAGVPKHMILAGICEKCAAKNNATLLRAGCAELGRTFPDMPEFKVLCRSGRVERRQLNWDYTSRFGYIKRPRSLPIILTGMWRLLCE